MKRYLLLFSLLFLLSACDKAPINGTIDGLWKLTSIHVTDGEIITPHRIFYAIYRHIVQISDKGTNGYGSYTGHFSKEDDELLIDRFVGIPQDAILAGHLRPFGINTPSTLFKKIKATSTTMVLQSDYATLHFKKF